MFCEEKFRRKVKKNLNIRTKWPAFATYDEDRLFRNKDKWNAYDNQRVVMYDNTNIQLRQPSCANCQRRTYSKYYGGNVGKGAVFIQPCGWMGNNELWQGAVSDSEYMQRGNVFSA